MGEACQELDNQDIDAATREELTQLELAADAVKLRLGKITKLAEDLAAEVKEGHIDLGKIYHRIELAEQAVRNIPAATIPVKKSNKMSAPEGYVSISEISKELETNPKDLNSRLYHLGLMQKIKIDNDPQDRWRITAKGEHAGGRYLNSEKTVSLRFAKNIRWKRDILLNYLETKDVSIGNKVVKLGTQPDPVSQNM